MKKPKFKVGQEVFTIYYCDDIEAWNYETLGKVVEVTIRKVGEDDEAIAYYTDGDPDEPYYENDLIQYSLTAAREAAKRNRAFRITAQPVVCDNEVDLCELVLDGRVYLYDKNTGEETNLESHIVLGAIERVLKEAIKYRLDSEDEDEEV